jgi:nucleoside-diphosphate-sugar epimerase
MRVLVIGGTNFIGPHVVAALCHKGHDVTVFHRGIHESLLPAAVRHIHSPRATLPFLEFPPELSNPNPDLVLHMFPVGEEDIKAAIARFTGVAGRIVAISSGDVYRAYGRLIGTEPGPPMPMPLDEDAPLRTTYYPYRKATAGLSDWTYHYDKVLAEQALLSSGELLATVLRLPAVRPGDPYSRLRPYLKRMADRRGGILMEMGQSTWRWTHGYVEDIASAVVMAIEDSRAAGRVYNLGEPETPTMLERVRRLGDVAGWDGKIIVVPAGRMPAHLRTPFEPTQDLVMDTRRIRDELGFSEHLSETEAFRRTMRWESSIPSQPGDPGPSEYAEEDSFLSAGG